MATRPPPAPSSKIFLFDDDSTVGEDRRTRAAAMDDGQRVVAMLWGPRAREMMVSPMRTVA